MVVRSIERAYPYAQVIIFRSDAAYTHGTLMLGQMFLCTVSAFSNSIGRNKQLDTWNAQHDHTYNIRRVAPDAFVGLNNLHSSVPAAPWKRDRRAFGLSPIHVGPYKAQAIGINPEGGR
jgi:hypothetical protein